MRQCEATTRKGGRCGIEADHDSNLCHVHRPDGTYQRQRHGSKLATAARVEAQAVTLTDVAVLLDEAAVKLQAAARRLAKMDRSATG